MKTCPICNETLKDDAIVCTHCGHQFRPIPAEAESGARPTPAAAKIGCGIAIIAAMTLLLWYFSASYQG